MLTLARRAEFRPYFYDEIPEVWDQVRPLIKRALDRGSDYTLEDILEGLLKRDMQLWTWKPYEIQAVLVTSIQNTHERKWCLLLACAGEQLQEWVDCLEWIEEWARNQGCQEMRIYGRSGWSKVLGYTIDFTRMSKPLWTDP